MVLVRRCLGFSVSVAVLLVVFVLAGMGQFEIPTWPTLPGGASSGDSIDFGDVAVGQTGSAQYTFKVLESSETAATVTVYDPRSPFALSGLAARSMTLQPGKSVTFNVTFTPTEAKTYSCSFKIKTEGGYRVQVRETIVQLSGRGTSTDAGPSESPGTTIPGFLTGLMPLEPRPAGEGDRFEGTTDKDGEFRISVPPATTVIGRLSECEGGPIAAEVVRVSLDDGGYGISVYGYQEAMGEAVSRVAIFGIETISLGEICLLPLAQPAQVTGLQESDTCNLCVEFEPSELKFETCVCHEHTDHPTGELTVRNCSTPTEKCPLCTVTLTVDESSLEKCKRYEALPAFIWHEGGYWHVFPATFALAPGETKTIVIGLQEEYLQVQPVAPASTSSLVGIAGTTSESASADADAGLYTVIPLGVSVQCGQQGSISSPSVVSPDAPKLLVRVEGRRFTLEIAENTFEIESREPKIGFNPHLHDKMIETYRLNPRSLVVNGVSLAEMQGRNLLDDVDCTTGRIDFAIDVEFESPPPDSFPFPFHDYEVIQWFELRMETPAGGLRICDSADLKTYTAHECPFHWDRIWLGSGDTRRQPSQIWPMDFDGGNYTDSFSITPFCIATCCPDQWELTYTIMIRYSLRRIK